MLLTRDQREVIGSLVKLTFENQGMKLETETSLHTLELLYENEIYDENLVKMVLFAIHNTEYDVGDEQLNSYKAQMSFIFYQNHLLEYVQRRGNEKLFTLIDLFTSSCMQYDAETAASRKSEESITDGGSDGGERATLLDFQNALRYKQ